MSLPAVSDSLQTYLIQINRFPLLSKEEEFDLAVRYRKYNDLTAAQKLITSNLRFVVKIALEYKGFLAKHNENSIKLSDLIQEGNIGLMKAVKRFDPYKGFRLITYAVWWIRAQIQQFIIKTLGIIKKSTSELRKKLFSQFDKTQNALAGLEEDDTIFVKRLGSGENHIDYPSHTEAETLPVSPDTNYLSLDREISEEGDTTLLDILSDPTKNQEEAIALKEEEALTKERLRAAFRYLNEKEKIVITGRYLNEPPLTLQAIGDRLGITRERVRQIETKALKKLKERLRQYSLPVPTTL